MDRFNVIDIHCHSNFSSIRIRKWKFNHMQTIASTLVVQKVVIQIPLSCTSLDGKCILEFAILYPLMQIFFQWKGLKVFAQLETVENVKYTWKWCAQSILHTHSNIKCILFIKSFTSPNKNEPRNNTQKQNY